MSRKRSPWAQSCSATSKSAPAFSSHCRTKWRSATSGSFIEDTPVLVGRVSDPSDDVLRFLEALAGDDDDVDGILHVSQRAPDPDATVAGVGRVRFHYQQVEVAVF